MPSRFDAIVIGSGLGGLTAGAYLARTGRRVLVLERGVRFGGAATSYKIGDLTVEYSLHQLEGFGDDDPKAAIFAQLGLTDKVKLVPEPNFYEVRSPVIGAPLTVPYGFDAAQDALVALFPSQRANLIRYFEIMRAANQIVTQLLNRIDGFWWYAKAPPAHLPPWLATVLTDQTSTLTDQFNTLFGNDEAVKIALSGNIGYYMNDPGSYWFLAYAGFQGHFLNNHGYYVYGGSQTLSNALVKIITDAGGEARLERIVTEIVLDSQGRAAGVVHESARTGPGGGRDRREDHAPVLFGSAAPTVLADALPADKREAFLAPYAGRKPSTSLFSVGLGFSRDPKTFGLNTFSTMIFPDWMTSLADYSKNAAIMSQAPGPGVPDPALILVNYSAIDSGLSGNPPYSVSAGSVDDINNYKGLSPEQYRQRREQWIGRIIDILDGHYPGLKSAVVERGIVTAQGMHEHLNTPQGATYGFAMEPPGAGRPFLPTVETAIPGLLLSSVYVIGGGYTSTMVAGAAAAKEALQQLSA